jgi:hypothetical protein
MRGDDVAVTKMIPRPAKDFNCPSIETMDFKPVYYWSDGHQSGDVSDWIAYARTAAGRAHAVESLCQGWVRDWLNARGEHDALAAIVSGVCFDPKSPDPNTDPRAAAELEKLRKEIEKTVAEVESIRVSTKKTLRESAWWQGFVSPAGLAVFITAAGLATTYFTGWFSAEDSRLKADHNLVQAQTERLELKKELLTDQKDELTKATKELDHKRTALLAENSTLRSENERAQSTIAATDLFFKRLVETGASLGPENQYYRLEFSKPTGPVDKLQKFSPPSALFSVIREQQYSPSIRESLLGRVTAVWFFDVPLTATDIRSLNRFKSLASVSLLYDKGTEPNAALAGFERIAGKLQDFSLRGQFDAKQATAVVSRLTQCRSLTLEGIEITAPLCKAIRGLPNLGTLSLSNTKVSKALFAKALTVRELHLMDDDLSELREVPRPELPNLTFVWVLGGTVAVDGDLLTWIGAAPGLDQLQMSNVRITDKLCAAMLAMSPAKLQWINLFGVSVAKPDCRTKLLKHFGGKLRGL